MTDEIMDNPYANIVYPADLEDLSKAFSALARVHIRHESTDDNSYDCQHCPCVCTEPCFCVYQSVKSCLRNRIRYSKQLSQH